MGLQELQTSQLALVSYPTSCLVISVIVASLTHGITGVAKLPAIGLFQITLKKGPNLFSPEGIRNRAHRAEIRGLNHYTKVRANTSMLD